VLLAKDQQSAWKESDEWKLEFQLD